MKYILPRAGTMYTYSINFSLIAHFDFEYVNKKDTLVHTVSFKPRTLHTLDSLWPLFGVHSIMIQESAKSGEGGGEPPPPFTISTFTYIRSS